jgi:hypothetical protein
MKDKHNDPFQDLDGPPEEIRRAFLESLDKFNLSPAGRAFIIAEYEKNGKRHAAMRRCPAFCLMMIKTCRSKIMRYVPEDFWQNRAFCFEAVKQNELALDYVPDQWQKDAQALCLEKYGKLS